MFDEYNILETPEFWKWTTISCAFTLLAFLLGMSFADDHGDVRAEGFLDGFAVGQVLPCVRKKYAEREISDRNVRPELEEETMNACGYTELSDDQKYFYLALRMIEIKNSRPLLTVFPPVDEKAMESSTPDDSEDLSKVKSSDHLHFSATYPNPLTYKKFVDRDETTCFDQDDMNRVSLLYFDTSAISRSIIDDLKANTPIRC